MSNFKNKKNTYFTVSFKSSGSTGAIFGPSAHMLVVPPITPVRFTLVALIWRSRLLDFTNINGYWGWSNGGQPQNRSQTLQRGHHVFDINNPRHPGDGKHTQDHILILQIDMMKYLGLSSLVLPLLALSVKVVADPASQLESVFNQARSNIYAQLNEENAALAKRGIQPTCTPENLAIRQELYVSFTEERCSSEANTLWVDH